MFIGDFRHKINAKGRVSVPAVFREQFGDTLYAVRGYEQSLSLYTSEEWDHLNAQLQELSRNDAKSRRYLRKLYNGASKLDIDQLGRILIPQPLRDHAGLVDEVVFSGAGKIAELWSVENFENYLNEDDVSFEELGDHLASLGV